MSLGKRKGRDDPDGDQHHGSTLFVSNLPYDTTSTDLQTAFSDFAPVRSAFVVLEHVSGLSKGVGYVSFSIKEDAQTAFESIATNGLTINGRSIRVQWAESKQKNKTKDLSIAEVVTKEKATRVPNLPAQNDPHAIRTIVVSGLPSSVNLKTLWKKFRKFQGAEDVEWPAKTVQGEDLSTAHVLFSSSALAQDAVCKLHAHVFKGSLLSVTLKKRLESLAKTAIKKPTSGTTPSRSSRLIIRNLPFDITEQDIRAIFLPYGPIHSIHIPLAEVDHVKLEGATATKPPCKTSHSKGFAFVWMWSKKDAESALEHCNGTRVVAGIASSIVADKQKRKKLRREEKTCQSIETQESEGGELAEEPTSEQTESGGKGRIIAVDWALSKERWENAQVQNDVEMDGSESAMSAGEDSEVVVGDNHFGLHEDSGDEDEEGDNHASEDGGPPERDDDDDKSPQKPQLPHTDTGNTLFIRNIPFTATEDEIRTMFRAFGPLRYVRLAIDPETERPRGTGFACFWDKQDADSAIKQSEILRAETMGTQTQTPKNPFSLPSLLTPDPSAGLAKNLVLHGRTLDVVRAVTREQATKLKEDGEKRREKSDKRNLYLLREGVILPNSPAASTIPQVELEKRTTSFNARRTMLRSNPSLYVSKTRLSIRQIPLFVTERALKRLAIHSVREFNAEVKRSVREGLSPDELAPPTEADDQTDESIVKTGHDNSQKGKVKAGRPTGVKQAKIVRQSDRADPVTGKGRSRGYGFIEMHTHADALRVLRWANNNPDVGALFNQWWKEELTDLVGKEKGKESADEARIKRMKDDMEAPSKLARGFLIVEFSIENIQVVHRRTTQKEKLPQPHRTRKPTPSSTAEPPAKKRRISSSGDIRPVQIKEESAKPGKTIGSMIGRKRRARKSAKVAR